MVKERVYVEEFREIPVEYDKSKYKISGFESLNVLVISRLSDGEVVYISNQCLDYVIQIDLENQTHFVIGEHDNENKCAKLKDYILDENKNYVELKNEFVTNINSLYEIRGGEHTFKVEQDGYSCCLYNLKSQSQRYNRIYDDTNTRLYLNCGENTLLVEALVADGHTDLTDKIQYLIDLDTYEIVSDIKSEMQQRDIPIYSEEDAEELKLKLYDKVPVYNAESATIYNEITKYLSLIPERYYKSPNVYSSGKINEEYVRSFKRKNQK